MENCGFVFAKQSFFTKKMDVVLWLSATPCRVGKRASVRLVACAGRGGASSADDDGDEAAAAPPEVDLSVMSFTLGTLLFLLELFLSNKDLPKSFSFSSLGRARRVSFLPWRLMPNHICFLLVGQEYQDLMIQNCHGCLEFSLVAALSSTMWSAPQEV